MQPVTIWVNGAPQARSVEPRTHLADFLRDDCRLTGTHIGCEHGVCGACTVLVDGQPARSCITFAAACDGSRVTTVEGYDDDPVMRRLRAAFTAHHALQCGYCTPGMLATSRDIVLRLPQADETRIRHELAGNICRCTGYMGIVAAIDAVLTALRETPDPEVDGLRAAALGRRDDSPAADGSLSGTSQPGIVTAAARAAAGDAAAAPSSPEAIAPPAGAGEADTSMAGRTAITGAFQVAAAADAVWAFMSDLPKVAACLPGAQLTGQDGERLDGRVAVRFGPIHAEFAGQATLRRDDSRRSAVLSGSGQDARSRSRTQADVRYRLSQQAPGTTRVDVELLYALQGPLAQFSRSGLVRDLVTRLIAEFGANVDRALAGGSGPPAPAARLDAGGLLWSVIVARWRRWFGGRG